MFEYKSFASPVTLSTVDAVSCCTARSGHTPRLMEYDTRDFYLFAYWGRGGGGRNNIQWLAISGIVLECRVTLWERVMIAFNVTGRCSTPSPTAHGDHHTARDETQNYAKYIQQRGGTTQTSGINKHAQQRGGTVLRSDSRSESRSMKRPRRMTKVYLKVPSEISK